MMPYSVMPCQVRLWSGVPEVTMVVGGGLDCARATPEAPPMETNRPAMRTSKRRTSRGTRTLRINVSRSITVTSFAAFVGFRRYGGRPLYTMEYNTLQQAARGELRPVVAVVGLTGGADRAPGQ